MFLARKHQNPRSVKNHLAVPLRTRGGTGGAQMPGERPPTVSREGPRPSEPPGTCMDRTVSSRCSRSPRTMSGSSTAALGSGKRENLSPTSNCLRRLRASSMTPCLGAGRAEHRHPPAVPRSPAAAPGQGQRRGPGSSSRSAAISVTVTGCALPGPRPGTDATPPISA